MPVGRSGAGSVFEPRTEGVAHGHAGLLDAGGGQGGEADHVAGRVDVRHGGADNGRRRVSSPRGPGASPAAGRFSAAVLLERPAATSTASTQQRAAGIERQARCPPRVGASQPVTLRFQRNSMPSCRRIASSSASETS